MPLCEGSPDVAIQVEDNWRNSNFRDEVLSSVCVCRQTFKSKFENDLFDVPEGTTAVTHHQNERLNISVTTRYGHELFQGFCLCWKHCLSWEHEGKQRLTPGNVKARDHKIHGVLAFRFVFTEHPSYRLPAYYIDRLCGCFFSEIVLRFLSYLI